MSETVAESPRECYLYIPLVRAGVQSQGRSHGVRNCSGRGRGRSSREQRKSNEPPRVPLNIESIVSRTDVVKAIFPFTPSTQPGFYLPDNIDTSDPQSYFY